MQIITPFDPSAATSGSIQVGLVNRCAVLYLINESSYGLQLQFQDGHTAILPPWYARAYKLHTPGAVAWTQQYNISPASAPISIVQGEGYEPSEVDMAQLSQGPLTRQTNIGNSVPLSSSATSITNDTNNAATQIVEARVTGDAASAVTLTNDGTEVLGSSTRVGSLTVQGTALQAAGSGVITTGSVKLTGPVAGAASQAKISSDATGNLNIDIPDGTRRLQLTSSTLTTPGTFTATGLITGSAGITSNGNLTLGSGKIQLIIGSLTRMTAISGTGNGTVNTNAGTTPNTIAFDPCTLSGSSQTIGGTTAQSTVVTTGSGLAWAAMSYTQ